MALKPDPNDPLQTQHQVNMLQVFENLDYIGLEQYIVKSAKLQCQQAATPPRSYKLIMEDYEKKTGYVFALLHQLPPAVIRSLIRNTLPFDKINDSEVRAFYESEMTVKNPCAGVYIQWVSNAPGTVLHHAGAVSEGKFLTSKQVSRLLDLVQGYLENKPNSVEANNTIDKVYNPSFRSNDARQRGKPIGRKTAPKVKEWITTVRRQYCTGIDPGKEDDAFLRTPMEVGWSQDVPSRIKEHDYADKTTALLYLVNAIARKIFNLPNKEHALLFPVPHSADADFYSLAEVLASILCSSYHHLGGLNHHLAGGSNIITLDKDQDVWWNSARYFNRRLQLGHVTNELSRLHHRVELLATAQELPALRKEANAADVAYQTTTKEQELKAEQYRDILKVSRQRQQEAKQANKGQAIGEAGDEARELYTILEKCERIEKKHEIWSMVSECVDTDDERMGEIMMEHLAQLDRELVGEVMQEFAEIQKEMLKEKEAREKNIK